MIKIVLVDDHAVVRSGLHLLLDAEEDMEVIGEAGRRQRRDLPSSRAQARRDLAGRGHAGESGIESPADAPEGVTGETKVLVLSMQDDPATSASLLRRCGGDVLKEAADEEVVSAVREIADGGHYVHPTLGAAWWRRGAGASCSRSRPSVGARNGRCSRLLALGHTNQERAQALFISVRTAESQAGRTSSR